jgi:AhpD family alkylhydroperoxidase
MEKRIRTKDAEPEAYKVMYAMENYMGTARLTRSQRELVKIRASQINGCYYCINMHSKDALKNGETAQRIFLLAGWRETDLFTAEEKALLAVTEEVTLIHDKGLTDETYREAAKYFDKNQLAQIIMAVIAINGWNRIAIGTRMGIEE